MKLGEVNEAVTVSFQFSGCLIEGVSGRADFAGLVVLHADAEVSGGEGAEAGCEVDDGTAKAGGDPPDEAKGEDPDQRGEEPPYAEESPAKILGSGDTGLGDLGG